MRRTTEDALFEQEDFRYSAGILEQQLRTRLRGGLSVSERRLDRDRIAAYLSQLDVSVAKLTALRRGFVSFEGQNIRLEQRFAGGHMDRLPPLAAELVALKVDVLVTASTQGGHGGQERDADQDGSSP